MRSNAFFIEHVIGGILAAVTQELKQSFATSAAIQMNPGSKTEHKEHHGK
jgi:hypothetical protein